MNATTKKSRRPLWLGLGVVALVLIAIAVYFKVGRRAQEYIYGMESYVYGYPIVMMDVTREVLTAAPAPNSEGTAAPINQLAKMPHYVDPDFKNVVRISLNSLWTTGWVGRRILRRHGYRKE